LAVNPPTADSLIGVASCYQFLSKYDEALLYLNQAQNLEPQNSDVYYAFGFLFLNKEDFDNAKLNLENSLKYNPDNQKSKKLLLFVIEQENNKLLDKAFYYIDNKKYSDAIAVLDTAIKINPENSVNHYYKGSIHFLQHKYFLAIDEFQKAIKIILIMQLLIYSLANSYDAVKNYKEAKLNYEKYISLSKEETPELIKAKARVEKIKD
jgi:tetratricopeptide (TPR) repeat protein